MHHDADAHGPGSTPATAFDYLLLSDLHLGSDLVTHVRPWAASSWLTRESDLDEQLVSMLAHHRRVQHPGRRLRVVIVGDFLELVGVSLPAVDVRTVPTREERAHGLGSAADHVVAKVRAIAARHPRVFGAFMELVRDGHELVVVRGNHDIELHWQAARRALVDAIVEHAEADQQANLRARVSIVPWFYLVPGLLYVEHGHQFDPMCSYGDPLLPTCPRDTRRIRRVPFSVMLRNVARPTRGLSTASYEHVSFGTYLQLLRKLGWSGSARIARRFASAALCLIGEWTAQLRGEREPRCHAARIRKARFARRVGVSAKQLAQLESFHVRPAARSLSMVLRSLYLDRVFALFGAVGCVLIGALLARYRGMLEGVSCALPAIVFAAYTCVGSDRGIEPTPHMRAGAAAIAHLLSVRWVVMGHTHQAGMHELGTAAQYVNVGHWGEDDLPEERHPRASANAATYLHLKLEQGRYRADLLRWDSQAGASRLLPELPARPEGLAPMKLPLSPSTT
jgi:UDP-2,3-diacylglucosamine pyrophosphatase LpxH/transcriptional regulator with XRE-family HTH domain